MTAFVASPMGTAGPLWHYYDCGIRNSDIMRPTQYSTATLIDLFHRHTVASLPEVMAALGTRARRTAFRKLKELPYRTSYSHRGGYYTLEELIDFDQHGLWSFRAVRFSAAGTLLATTAELVSDAPAGQFSEELDNLLHVGTPGCPAQARPAAQADPPESCRPVSVLRRRPHPQGAATERPARPAGRPRAGRTGAGCRPHAGPTARRYRAVRQLARRTPAPAVRRP